MSNLLSPAAKGNQAPILNNATRLDATHLVCLALNEQCRVSERGHVYHLPLRQNKMEGHPCDAVFIDGTWSKESTAKWDRDDWLGRLNTSTAGTSTFDSGVMTITDEEAVTMLPRGQKVIPLCLRILEFDDHAATVQHAPSSDWSDLLTPDSEDDGRVHCNGLFGVVLYDQS